MKLVHNVKCPEGYKKVILDGIPYTFKGNLFFKIIAKFNFMRFRDQGMK